MDLEEEKTWIKRKYGGAIRKSMIIRNKSRGIKLLINYNTNGVIVGESYVHLNKLLRCIETYSGTNQI